MKRFIDKYALFASIIVGAVGFPLFYPLTPALPPLLFVMLFFTFCKVNPLDLRLRVWHCIAMAVQLVLSLCSYLIVIGLSKVFEPLSDPAVAQSVMLCFLMPSATAAPIIAGKLGGSIQNLTTYTLITNLSMAVIVPVLFPMITDSSVHTSVWVASKAIFLHIAPVLLGPLCAAWLLRLGYNLFQRSHGSQKTFTLSLSWAQVPFYAWIVTILILMGNMTHTLVYAHYSGISAIAISVGAGVACLIQFYLGKSIGYRFPASSHGLDYQDVVINPATAPKTPAGISRVTAGQALGQKNTTLAIWMAQTYLSPLAALGPAVYMIVQNIFNSLQLARAAQGNSRSYSANV